MDIKSVFTFAIIALLSGCGSPYQNQNSEPEPVIEQPEPEQPEPDYTGIYFVAPGGNDANDGSINAPFATINRAEQAVQPGETIYLRGGIYHVTEAQIGNNSESLYARVFPVAKSGTADSPINIFAWPPDTQRPVFDLSAVKPQNKRVTVFYVTGSYRHFKGFDVIGTQVMISGHTQSECFRNRGNNNTYENLVMRDGMAIGFYLERGSNNLVQNCDAYNNWDSVSEGGKGGNVDGFGGHPANSGSTGNVFRGCRAWLNSDDGFDLISAAAACVIEYCWAFRNGYSEENGIFTARGDGSGLKAGGYGMGTDGAYPNPAPRHTVRFCVAAENLNNGIYSNHHLGGIDWYNNSAYRNASNYSMVNRKSAAENIDVDGYDHVLKNNLSYTPRSTAVRFLDYTLSISEFNSWDLNMALLDSDFESLDYWTELRKARTADGGLPETFFLKPKPGSQIIDKGTEVGFSHKGKAPDLGYIEF